MDSTDNQDSQNSQSREQQKECLPRVKGFIYLTLVIIIWVGSAVLIQMIFESDDS